MLFAYTYVPHPMEKMQAYIDFIFHKVWCKAPIGLVFSPDLFAEELDLRGIISQFGFAANAPERGKQFYKNIKGIYELFAALTPPQIDQLKQWYQANNDIEKVCANDPTNHIIRYTDILVLHPKLSKQFASFFRGLYDHSLLNLVVLRDKIGEISAHNKEFFKVNGIGKCPFCGISDLKGIHHTRREAYDHYLPKYRYPFNSMNFRNLAPACHECNSSYKLSKDPVRNAAGRRKAFYPYANPGQSIEITIDFSKSDVNHLQPDDVQLTFEPSALNEEIETWKDVYGIEERYKAKCCTGDAKAWLEDYRILNRRYGATPKSFIDTIEDEVKYDPFANQNFFKKAFIDGCDRQGILEAIATGN